MIDHGQSASALGTELPDVHDSGAVTVWRSVGQGELDAVASSGWRAWPPRLPDQPIFSVVSDRRHAVRICRERIVPAEGVGYVARFDLPRRFLDRFEGTGRNESEYRIPANEVAGLNTHVIGVIVEDADYRGPVDDAEFAEAEQALGRPLPRAWRSYLQGASWFRRGWLASETYVWLNTPREMLGLHEAWDEATDAHPGIAIIGGNGSREQLVLDLRKDPAPVLLLETTSAGWETGIRQTGDVGELVDRIESGEFEFSFDE
ncbi:hypothetical protein GCM10010168_60820 [Actinoplanes ianthinogenes]|uniref:Uncharacterized protein n=1 Tax=Actinoplanes ianthinogenes TaxID=122358 RepID=A0ABM7M4J1_9ACTN|nr:SMI1/KNR4 family protein [Actinoplanes ianthinogenes]BCJ46443.1 hypothetical protein Aiant_71000 [Actinoplanes ianthinogenes]GGR34288.1 hypothetical protein GCM10010168_60820 [Actinoplanes ianthinogenes]